MRFCGSALSSNKMLGRWALVCGLVVSCSGTAPHAAHVAQPALAAPPASKEAPNASATAVAVAAAAEAQAPDAEPIAPARTELVLSDEPMRDVIVRFDPAACSDNNEGTELEIEIRIDDKVWDTLTVGTDNAPASCAEYGRTVELGDYNFDGHQDLAVPIDNAGSYWGPTFAILLYQPLTGHYLEAPKLTALTRENLGLFRVDPKRKRLTIFNKSGCCIHYQSDVAVAGDAPTVVSSQVESIIYDGENATCRVTLERTLPNGKTLTTSRRCNKNEQQ